MPDSLVEIWGMLWGKIKPLSQHFAGCLTQAWPLKSLPVFIFFEHLSGYDNIFETEA